ncbi:MAG: ribosome biogenesis/translation initiation ATPase RLI [Candidatus Woesearchaeota archaeon]|jgi:ATP-binding cassette subfamily E protein 1|nr:ribosome biogenesis/translation initiation ATPase RLI [Candidatus Woesearchaeota archaeon]MDP7458431.1 ribosome biogenesis/translation initiation ATPase RLI [Candidatus Woesearchaeota archaeon]
MTRIAVIEKEKCNPIGCGNYLCIRVCPINKTGEECIVKGEDMKPNIDESLCTGCGICPKRCPYDAISIINLPEELTDKPIHRYGENGFSLYNLPVPIFGKVVGVLGKNGIGKSTAIKVLAGILDPNLGETGGGEVDFDKLLEFFKGTEAQIFFEKVRDKKIKISYKPQQVDLIPKTTKGKVKTLLRKVDEKKQFDKIVKELQLGEILDNDITKISGGELQRVAIAATVLKKANLYIFDEPTSYLDIKQRLRVSKFIKGLANENTAVLVVEHDLIILDYMTELIHMMYGKENVYGIVSMPKSTKAGINVYLSGFLKEENVRFRDSKIKFEVRPPVKQREGTTLTSWEGVKKKLGKFSLEAGNGEVLKREVIGILGENGIGKTSFVKILAGVDEQDEGKITEKIKVSYKSQYLESDSSEVVVNFLRKAIQKYTNQLINPLHIKPLFMKKLNELSGGELQRVSIALCLSQDADLYLLDEPSAYLDVEQRLIVSKIIGDFMDQKGSTALIVDHDLLFIDYISQNLIVFDGKPAIEGRVDGPFTMEEGMNLFLKGVGVTFRRDNESHRPRANKVGSFKDREQKDKGKLYYG